MRIKWYKREQNKKQIFFCFIYLFFPRETWTDLNSGKHVQGKLRSESLRSSLQEDGMYFTHVVQGSELDPVTASSHLILLATLK